MQDLKTENILKVVYNKPTTKEEKELALREYIDLIWKINDLTKEVKQLSTQRVMQAKPEKVCELILQKFDDWVFGLETQEGEKLKVVDSTDFNEIITEIESELKNKTLN